jgi:glucose/sorbosone dehydrogenase
MSECFSRSFIVFVCAIASFAAPVQAQTEPVTIAWDPSPDPSVTGYVVYVGTEPDAPRETFDVSGTSFTYRNAVSGRPYFFSVAAHAAGGRAGYRSEEILFLTGGRSLVSTSDRGAAATVTDDEKRAAAVRARRARLQSGPLSTERLCVARNAGECYAPVAMIGDFGPIHSLKALGDGRLIFIESGTRIVIVNPERDDIPAPAAVTSDTARFMSLAVDPQFIVTHLIYAAEAEMSADGAVRVNIARYRELDGTLGERAVVISGLAVPRDGTAPLALDGSGHLYVALPQMNSRGIDSYAGMVLRFRTDGSLPADSRAASPLFARGAAEPAALDWEQSSNSLWLVDAPSPGVSTLQRVRLDREGLEWPRDPEIVRLAAHDGIDVPRAAAVAFESSGPFHGFIVAGQPAKLYVMEEDADGEFWTAPLSGEWLEGEPTDAVHNGGELDVAVRIAGGNSGFATRILRLRSVSSLH